MKWVEDRCGDLNPDGSLDLVYRIDGSRDLDEELLPHLSGYRQSRPVRVGNQAHKQLQLDIYGELMDAVYIYDKYGQQISRDLWTNLRRLVDWVAAHYHQPDEGIWEVRSARQHFLVSRLMCWVAVDRGIRLATRRSLPAPLDRWHQVRDAIYEEIHTDYFDRQLGAFTQVPGQPILDSATLLMPLVRFISPTDPRWVSTLRQLEQNLRLDSLFWRYRGQRGSLNIDGLTDDEGTFNMCSFWFVECLSRSGDVNQARLYFEKMAGYANHLGLYAEELGLRGEQLGNFPQAFTHLALISAAFDVDRRLDAAGWRA
jgi:GH15 family glucan-1,4-alpha-glucosidase